VIHPVRSGVLQVHLDRMIRSQLGMPAMLHALRQPRKLLIHGRKERARPENAAR
jgi:hypothetical protein